MSPATSSQKSPETISRGEAVERLKHFLLQLVDDEHSICQIAAAKGIFCGGFKRYSDTDLKRKYAWVFRHDPTMSREDLEDMANRWQLARQLVDNVPIACDVQQIERDQCRGWDDFTNDELTRYCQDLLGQNVEVTS